MSAPFVGKKYFNIQPLNNVNSFSFTSGQSVIRFALPPMNNALLDKMIVNGKFHLDVDSAGTSYKVADIDADKLFSIDSVNALHNMISKVQISTRRGALDLQQNNLYDINSKVKVASFSSPVDLNYGKNSCMNIASTFTAGTMRRLTREAGRVGTDFSLELEMGILRDASQRIDLGKIGGVEILIYLNSNENLLFNLDNAEADLLNNNYRYSLQSVQMFGAYQMYNPSISNQFQQLVFKDVNLNQQVLNSSLDTNGYSPQVQSMDNLVIVCQPNTSARNNFETNAQQTNECIGQKSYKTSKNGMPFPMTFDVVNTTAKQDIVANNIADGQINGNPEAVYHLCVSQQNKYPPDHMCSNAKSEYDAYNDIAGFNSSGVASTNLATTNFLPIGISYQYGFDGYNTNMSTDLIQVQIESAVNTADANIDPTIRAQAQTVNNLTKYNAVLPYSNLMVSR